MSQKNQQSMVSTFCIFGKHQVMCVCPQTAWPCCPHSSCSHRSPRGTPRPPVRLSATAPVGLLQGSVISLHNKDTIDHSSPCELPDFCAWWQAFRFSVEASQGLQRLAAMPQSHGSLVKCLPCAVAEHLYSGACRNTSPFRIVVKRWGCLALKKHIWSSILHVCRSQRWQMIRKSSLVFWSSCLNCTRLRCKLQPCWSQGATGGSLFPCASAHMAKNSAGCFVSGWSGIGSRLQTLLPFIQDAYAIHF